MQNTTHAPEFSRLLSIEGIIPDKLREETVSATPEECEALAKRLTCASLKTSRPT